MPINLVVHQLLISSLNDPDSTIRAVTICTLRKLKSADPEGHYQMALILKNKDSWNMRYAHDALMELKPTDSKVVRELELLLQDSDSFTRRRALDILMVSQVLKAKHRSMLIALSEDPDKKVRETASKALEALSNI
jgi:HEAT repeat protein